MHKGNSTILLEMPATLCICMYIYIHVYEKMLPTIAFVKAKILKITQMSAINGKMYYGISTQ